MLKTGLRILSLLYFIFLVYAVFFARRRRHLTLRNFNLTPIKSLVSGFRDAPRLGIFNFYFNLLGNVALFIPIPFIFIWFFKINRFSTIVFAGFLISITIELLQYIFNVGVADIDDVILNTLGTVIGILFYKLLVRLNII